MRGAVGGAAFVTGGGGARGRVAGDATGSATPRAPAPVLRLRGAICSWALCAWVSAAPMSVETARRRRRESSTPRLVLLSLAALFARAAADEGSVDAGGGLGGVAPDAASPGGAPDAGGGGPRVAPADAAKALSLADRAFRDKDYPGALRLYGDVISATGGAPALQAKAYYGRHKAYVSTARLPHAVGDLSHALALEPGMLVARLQRANLLLMTGKCADAAADYERVLAADASKRDAASRLPHAQECARALERAEYARQAGAWHVVRQALGEAVADGRATHAPALLLQRAEAALASGAEGAEAALADLARVLKMDASNLRAYALRGRALYGYGDYATARATWQSGLRVDPEDAECKAGYKLAKRVLAAREAGDAAAARGAWAEAAEAYDAGYAADRATPVWGREVLPKLARAQARAGRAAAAAASAHAALALSDDLADAHAVLAEAALAAEDFDEAARRAKRAAELDRGAWGDLAARAEAALKQSKTKDYYRILGASEREGGRRRSAGGSLLGREGSLSRDAGPGGGARVERARRPLLAAPPRFPRPRGSPPFSYPRRHPHTPILAGLPRNADEKDIKRAYRKLALEFHPDRVDGEDAKLAAAKRFQDIGEAYEVLSDAEKRGKYDRGEDVGQGGQQPGGPQGHPFGHPFGGGFHHQGFHQQFHFRQG